MARIKLEDLKRIQDQVKATTTLRAGGNRAKVVIHLGTCGIAAGGRKVMQALLDEIAKEGVKDVVVTTSGCAGLCSREPMATVEILDQAPVKYVSLDEKKIVQIFHVHVMGGNPVEAYALGRGSERMG